MKFIIYFIVPVFSALWLSCSKSKIQDLAPLQENITRTWIGLSIGLIH